MKAIMIDAVFIVLLLWVVLYLLGNWIARRDKLQKVDAIVCLAGSRGNLNTLNEKVETAIRLYKKKWAPQIIASGMFSKRVSNDFKQIDKKKIELLVQQKRLSPKHSKFGFENWDLNLGANYIKRRAVEDGVPEGDILVENESTNTRENATFTAELLQKNDIKSIILVAAPYHQRRAFGYFRQALAQGDVRIINYAAESSKWSRFAWFLFLQNIKTVLFEVRSLWRHKNWRK